MLQKSSIQNGFTLIEMVIVAAMLAILMIGATGAYVTTRNRGEDARRRADIEALRQALELYRNNTGAYPIYTGGTEGTLKTTLTGNGYISAASYPKDPDGDKQYYYTSTAGTTYVLCANVNTVVSGFSCTAVGLANCGSAGAIACNFGTTQP